MTQSDGIAGRPDEANGPAAAPRLNSATVGALLALGAFFLITISGRGTDVLPSPHRMLLVLLWPVALLAYLWFGRASIVVAYCIAGGLLLRWAGFPGGSGSDVLVATREGIEVLLVGGNPYDHFYRLTIPPGAPFPYPPGQLLFHMPGFFVAGQHGVQFMELLAAAGVMVVLAVLAARVSWVAGLPALALYASLPNLVSLTTDGSNDTSTGAMLLFAVVAFARAADERWDRRAIVIAALVAALALSMKQTNLFVVFLLAVYLWHAGGRQAFIRFSTVIVVTLGIMSIPFLLMSPGDYLRELTAFTGYHENVYGWNVWVFVQQLGGQAWDLGTAGTLSIAVLAGMLIVAALLRYRSYTAATLAGVIITMVALLTARWTTHSYFAFVAPVAVALPLLAAREGLLQWVRPEIPDAPRPAPKASEPETPPDEPVDTRQRLPARRRVDQPRPLGDMTDSGG